MTEWTPVNQPPVIPFIYKGVYGFIDVEVQLADGRTATAEYSFDSNLYPGDGTSVPHPHNYWMVTVSEEEDGTYYWDETMDAVEYPERVPVVAWK